MKRQILTESELRDALESLNDWRVDGTEIKKKWELSDFVAALALVNKIGELAEAADHHPDITFGWGYAEVALTTHDRGGVTEVDIALAEKINAIKL